MLCLSLEQCPVCWVGVTRVQALSFRTWLSRPFWYQRVFIRHHFFPPTILCIITVWKKRELWTMLLAQRAWPDFIPSPHIVFDASPPTVLMSSFIAIVTDTCLFFLIQRVLATPFRLHSIHLLHISVGTLELMRNSVLLQSCLEWFFPLIPECLSIYTNVEML